VQRGLLGAVATLPTTGVLAIDGPEIAPWRGFVADVVRALADRGVPATVRDVRGSFLPWPKIVELTSSALLEGDPDFDALADGALGDLFQPLDVVPAGPGLTVVFGPGAALVEHDVLWYADLPKRYAEAAVVTGSGTNLGQRQAAGDATTKRLFYVDWPLLDRHRDAIAPRVDRWFDVQHDGGATSLSGDELRATIRTLSTRPFRTLPTFNATPWGGHWAQRELGMNREATNTALGYELIAPESGILCGDAANAVEVPFQLVVALHPEAILGPAVHETFGTSFPVRFDYLDTVDGGHLSVHLHPQSDYMRDVFGWPYTQHETYYMMVGGPDRPVFLGLHEDADVHTFRAAAEAAAHDGVAFDIERFVQSFPASQHQLFLIPAGTPHGSGAGNVVLEISATPYLYSLRFYDWLRRDAAGVQRPVHVRHAFENLNTVRRGAAVAAELVPDPLTLRAGTGWSEELLGRRPEMFFEVRRIVLDAGACVADDTAGRFHVLNVVDGDGVTLMTHDGHSHDLAYAETLVVPAAVGAYELTAAGQRGARVVKALVQ
jgi:mannose-6-phosphate isomerase class I